MEFAYLSDDSINEFIDRALEEDIRDGDHSTLSSIPEDAERSAQLLFKGDGIVAGLEMAKRIFKRLDPDVKIEMLKKDGDSVSEGEIGFRIHAKARTILTGERLALNCLQRMSGIATYTSKLKDMISHTRAKLLDTRKTTPNFRIMEKWAVAIGGGVNHRFGLFDMVMLKDNHVDFAGGIKNAIEGCKKYLAEKGLDLKIEVETRNIAEVEEVVATGGIHRIMLDNMLPSDMKEAVRIIDGKFETEASGGITEKTISDVAETGVDFISVGALTHSYTSLDISLKAIK
ncbi:MAG: carboxylating nicotinate-nucleotide diphosphorylase [bacterium]|nr:carboxylating nicotinate-nucleotide diphosphorylase [bacterium]